MSAPERIWLPPGTEVFDTTKPNAVATIEFVRADIAASQIAEAKSGNRYFQLEAIARKQLAAAEAELDRLAAENARLKVALRMPDADRRLWYISDLLARTGQFNRRDICEAFKVSVPQASADIKRWLNAHPHTATYNKSSKRYEINRNALAGKE